MFAGWIGRDDSLDLALGEFDAQTVGIIGPVSQQTARMWNHSDQTAGADQIVGVARGDQQGQRSADLVGQRMDFARLPATRTADGVGEGPPFAPAAERWALT